MKEVFVSGAFDDMRYRDIRFLQDASRIGPVAVALWPDAAVARISGKAPKFSFAERRYFLEALRYVASVAEAPAAIDPDRPDFGGAGRDRAEGATRPGRVGAVWALRSDPAIRAEGPSAAKLAHCESLGIELREIREDALPPFPYEPPPLSEPLPPGRPRRVVVTGCYDWVHTGHLRFFEEASAYGELNVVIGSDSNVRLLKGEGHPQQGEGERRYVVGSMRDVARCLVSTGSGWLDAEPEIRAIGAGVYVVNEDGDRPEKRSYCESLGLEYIVLKRIPKEGLPRRSSTDLRGF